MNISFEEIESALKVIIPQKGFVSGVSTDTRTLKAGELFIALSGENFNGNDYVREALEKGAKAAVCSGLPVFDKRVIPVKDTLAALLSIASHYRDRFKIPLAALTGSVGKTTTRGMVYKAISSKYKTLATESNLNNEIGVSKTLLELDPSYEAAVIEMGINHFGELKRMSLCAKPDVGIITNIGTAHIENLGSREGILKAKLEITAGMKKGAYLIINGDDDLLKNYKNSDYNIVKFGIGNKECDVFADDIKQARDGSYYTVRYGSQSAKGFVPSAGKHNVSNAVCAAAAAIVLGAKLESAVRAVESFRVEGMRQKIVRKDGYIFLEDCYNANPDSMAAALETLYGIDCKRKIAVLGDMLELGDYSGNAHKELGVLAAAKADVLYTYGELAQLAAVEAKKHGCKETRSFLSKRELSEHLAKTVQKGDAVLFKASRSMRLEDIINSLYNTLFKEKEG